MKHRKRYTDNPLTNICNLSNIIGWYEQNALFSHLGVQSSEGGEEEVGGRKNGSSAGAAWDTGRAE